MATDARGHTVPAATDHPQRQDLLALSLTTNGVTTVADTTARTAYIASLAAASPAQTVSTSKPAIVYRTDSGTLELSVDGTNWSTVPRRTDNTYSPVWASAGTQPVLGNGTLVANYSQDDKYIDFDLVLTLGSTSTVGTGNYSFTNGLPVAPAGGANNRGFFLGQYLDSSAGSAGVYGVFYQVIGASTTLQDFSTAFPTGSLSATAPAVPAVGDIYAVRGRYRWA